MEDNTVETKKTRAKVKANAPVIIDGVAEKKPLLRQGTTWAGLLSIGAAIATGGASVLTDPYLLAQIGAGLGLLFAEN